ncbi:MAG: hypothetical protein ACRBFS_24765 [Aureispira sp.]
MRTILFIGILSLLLNAPIIAQRFIKNTFVLENVRFKPSNNDGLQYIILEGKGIYERMDYPRVKIFINNELIADSRQLYGITIKNGHQFITTLKKVPKKFECLVVITTINHSDGHSFSFHTRKAPAVKEEKASSSPVPSKRNPKTKIAEVPCTVKEIVWMEEANQKFLRVNFTPSEEVFGWTYPILTVEINGKIVAQRGLSAYHLTEAEFLPTDLAQLPKHFKATVTVARYNAKEKVVLHYKQ